MLLTFEDIDEFEKFMKIFQTANNGGISDAEFDNFSNGLAILNVNVKHLENSATISKKQDLIKGLVLVFVT